MADNPRMQPTEQQLVLVAGVGRSGTSLFTSILGQLGYHVPQPEVDADSTNPKGFGEPRWVVDFHRRQLRARRVSVWDSRPSAWRDTAEAANDPSAFHELRSWLAVQFVGRQRVVVKDPRIGWFLPLWKRAADDLGVRTSFATLLRHPAEAVNSAIKWYGDWQNPASRTTSWLNIMLETEYATRSEPRVFIRYDELLSDWHSEISRAGRAFGDRRLSEVDEHARSTVEAFIDPSLRRSQVRWADLGVPSQVEQMTEQVWAHLLALATPEGDNPAARDTLDVDRDNYHRFYAEAEQVVQSSLHALRSPGQANLPPRADAGTRQGSRTDSLGRGADAAIRMAERVVPRKVLRRVPPAWRARLLRAAGRTTSLAQR